MLYPRGAVSAIVHLQSAFADEIVSYSRNKKKLAKKSSFTFGGLFEKEKKRNNADQSHKF